MSHHSDASDDLSYEDFDDVTLPDDDDLDAIDLDALDDEIESADEDESEDAAAIDPATGELLKPDDQPDGAPPRAQPKAAPQSKARPAAAADKPAPDDAPQPPTPAAPDKAADTTTDSVAEAADDEDQKPEPAAAEAKPTVTAAEAAAPKDDTKDKTPPAKPAAAADTESDDAGPPEPQPDWVYHVLIALPDNLRAEVLALREVGEIVDMPPPGILLGGAFRTAQIDAVQEALARWTRNHLPLQIERVGVWAEVVGQQGYVAAWSLQPDEELQEAQHNLRRALAAVITPLPTARTAMQVHLAISEHVPAHRYPHLIGQLQRDFAPFVWHANDLLFVRRNVAAASDDSASDANDWEPVATYN